MTRRRYVQIEGELVEVTPDYIPAPRNIAAQNGLLWNDRSYQDAGDKRFASRTQHKEFMARTGLTTADDFKDIWKNQEKKRIDVKNGIDLSRRKDIERSIHILSERDRRNNR